MLCSLISLKIGRASKRLKNRLCGRYYTQKYGFKSIVHANSIMEGGRAIARSSLVGGHAGGMSGLEGAEGHGKTY